MTSLRTTEAVAAPYPTVDARDVAQALHLVRALRDQLHEMTRELVRLERQDVTGTNGRASAIRCEAAELRRDMNEAQILIDRLQRRYLNDDGLAQPGRPAVSVDGGSEETGSKGRYLERCIRGGGGAATCRSVSFLLRRSTLGMVRAVQRMHGYQPGEVTPTTELVLAHNHPEDRDQIAQTIDTIRRTGQPLSSRHRIIDTSGKVRFVIVVGDELHDEGAALSVLRVSTSTPASDEREQQDQMTAQLAVISENRAVIEQPKGVLMAAYGITAGRAFEILLWRSQETNLKIRELALRFMTALSASHLSPEAVATSTTHCSHWASAGPTAAIRELLLTRSLKCLPIKAFSM